MGLNTFNWDDCMMENWKTLGWNGFKIEKSSRMTATIKDVLILRKTRYGLVHCTDSRNFSFYILIKIFFTILNY